MSEHTIALLISNFTSIPARSDKHYYRTGRPGIDAPADRSAPIDLSVPGHFEDCDVDERSLCSLMFLGEQVTLSCTETRTFTRNVGRWNTNHTNNNKGPACLDGGTHVRESRLQVPRRAATSRHYCFLAARMLLNLSSK